MADTRGTGGASRLQVILAGHNGDVEALRSNTGHFSPETVSAAYARISRYPDPVPELRRRAREEVQRARKSNRTIVFGLGHHSVAEHAVFNFDILGCSRLAIEALEWHRLCSYTEKSQRYITLDGDFVIPRELDPGSAHQLEDLIAEQNRWYRRLLPVLEARLRVLHPEMTERKADLRVMEGWAKEDARYVVSLATEGQLGLTCNARNLELIIRRMRSSPLEEIRRLGALLFDEARTVAPSLIILADEEAFREAYGTTVRDGYFRTGAEDLRRAAAAVEVSGTDGREAEGAIRQGHVALLRHTSDPDAAVIAGLLFAAGRGALADCIRAAARMDGGQRRHLVRRAMASLSEYDSPPRAFEEAVFHFELVVDASAMAQLKRHRMTSQQWGAYDPELDVTVPPAVEDVGQRDAFRALMDRTAEIHHRLKRTLIDREMPPQAADYALANAHRRRVALTMNLREIYHFSRLREDAHSQWAIRRIATDLCSLVRRRAPVTAALLAGKDRYADVYRRFMETSP